MGLLNWMKRGKAEQKREPESLENPGGDPVPEYPPRAGESKETKQGPESAAADSAPLEAPEEPTGLEGDIVDALRTVYDPEIPVNIYELGLVYGIEVVPEGKVTIIMTLTSPACPVAGSLPIEVEHKVRSLPGVSSVHIDLVWDPPWNPDMMSEAAKLQLGIF